MRKAIYSNLIYTALRYLSSVIQQVIVRAGVVSRVRKAPDLNITSVQHLAQTQDQYISVIKAGVQAEFVPLKTELNYDSEFEKHILKSTLKF